MADILQFVVMMKDKMRSHLNQSVTKPNLSPSNEYTFPKKARRTLGSEEDLNEQIRWNTSAQNLSHLYSPPKARIIYKDMEGIIEENHKLKQEIRRLKELLMDTSSLSKTYEKLDASVKSKKDEREQIQKLKKIIEKSYYWTKQMQQQIRQLKEQLVRGKNVIRNLEKRNKLTELEKEEAESKMINNNLIHRQQIQVLHERIRKLDVLTQHLVDMVEQDQRNWNIHMHELSNLKNFYSCRTPK